MPFNSFQGYCIEKPDSIINDLMNESGKTKVNLVGHSAYGGLVSNFILRDTVAEESE